MIRVALAQYQPAAAAPANLNLVGQIMERAGQEGVDIVCFSGDFLGDEPVPQARVISRLQELAKEFRVETLTGRIRLDDGELAQSVLIARDGLLIDWVPMGQVKPLRTCVGTTLVLSEEQAYSEEADARALELRPKVMVMQASANSLLELEAIKELAIDRSYNQAHLVVCISVVGRCRDENCLGASLAVLQGEILAEADTGASEIVLFSVDPAKFIDYDELRDPVIIPELLKQKYWPHVSHDTEP